MCADVAERLLRKLPRLSQIATAGDSWLRLAVAVAIPFTSISVALT
jgi:hypothetical protein